MLIDTGNPGVRDPERIFETAVKTAGLREINHLIVTHYHRDHFGGASQLSKLIPIRTVYDNATFEGQREFPTQDYKEFKTDKRVQINPGDVLKLAQADGGTPGSCFVARRRGSRCKWRAGSAVLMRARAKPVAHKRKTSVARKPSGSRSICPTMPIAS